MDLLSKLNSNSKTKKEAQDALDRFKMEVASEIGVNLKEGYNGDLTSAEAGSVGGNMVKKMIKRQEEQMSQGKESVGKKKIVPVTQKRKATVSTEIQTLNHREMLWHFFMLYKRLKAFFAPCFAQCNAAFGSLPFCLLLNGRN